MAPAPTVIAHRGAREAARENTLPAFRLAREFGAEWVELDARRTADGVVVVHHDAQLADGRVLAELTVDELPDFIPSLAEALEECNGMGVNIEIKNLPSDPDYDADHLVSEAVAGLVQAYLGPRAPLCPRSTSTRSIDCTLSIRRSRWRTCSPSAIRRWRLLGRVRTR